MTTVTYWQQEQATCYYMARVCYDAGEWEQASGWQERARYAYRCMNSNRCAIR